MAVHALRSEVVELFASPDGLIDLARPRIGTRFEGIERLDQLATLLPLLPSLRRERLDVLDDLVELHGRDIPGKHGRSMQTAPDDPDQVLVVRKLIAGPQARKLEDAFREVPRGGPKPVRRRAF